VVLRQPLADIKRQQKRLLAITRDKALSHAPDRLNLDRAVARLPVDFGAERPVPWRGWCVSPMTAMANWRAVGSW
jgi:hypothetical protein